MGPEPVFFAAAVRKHGAGGAASSAVPPEGKHLRTLWMIAQNAEARKRRDQSSVEAIRAVDAKCVWFDLVEVIQNDRPEERLLQIAGDRARRSGVIK
jgi:hypothetical protein